MGWSLYSESWVTWLHDWRSQSDVRRAWKRIAVIDSIHGIRFGFISMGESPFHISEIAGNQVKNLAGTPLRRNCWGQWLRSIHTILYRARRMSPQSGLRSDQPIWVSPWSHRRSHNSGVIFGKMQRLEAVNGSQLHFSVSSPSSKRIQPNLWHAGRFSFSQQAPGYFSFQFVQSVRKTTPAGYSLASIS